MSSPGFGVVRRRRSEAWERGESKGASGIDSWGSCRARALARRVRRLLQRALHRGGEVAAARVLLDIGSARGTAGELQREEGGRWGGSGVTRGCQREAKAKLELAGEAAATRRGSAAREAGEQGERRKGACLQYPKIPRT